MTLTVDEMLSGFQLGNVPRIRETLEQLSDPDLSYLDPREQSVLEFSDIENFSWSHVFDLGAASVVTVKTTLSSVVLDGEVLGTNTGDIQAVSDVFGTSFDGENFSPVSCVQSDGGSITEIGGSLFCVAMSARYLKVGGSWVNNLLEDYAGENNPVGVFVIEVEYVR